MTDKTLFVSATLGVLAYGPSLVSLAMGNKTHSIDCNALPSVEHVNEVLSTHKELVKKILQINPGIILVNADKGKCATGADILIIVGSHNDADKVKKLINSDTFFGG